MNDEEREITQSIAQEGRDVSATVNSKGWKEVIRPAFEAKIGGLIQQFSMATTYEEFVRIQQSVNAIKALTDFVEVKLIEGKVALDELRNNP